MVLKILDTKQWYIIHIQINTSSKYLVFFILHTVLFIFIYI